MLEPLVLPEDLSALSDDELAALLDEAQERAEYLHTADDAALAELGDQAVPLIENALATGELLDAENAKRETAREEQAQILADTRARLAQRLSGDAEPEGEPEGDPAPEGEPADPESVVEEDEPVVEPAVEPVAVAAAAAPSRRRAAPPSRSQARQEPTEDKPLGPKIMALSSFPGKFQAGDDLTMAQAAALMSEKWNRTHATDGPREDVPLVRFSVDMPEDRMLRLGDDVANAAKLEAITALVASGGICTPPEPYYDLQLLSTEDTPVVNSLPLFGAERGGIRWMTPPTLASITTATGIMTSANDAIGGTTATKTCQVLPCPAQNTAFIDAIYHCLTIGNFGARTWPELVENFMALTMASHARIRETKMLDAIKNGSTAVTGAQYNGAMNTLMGELNVVTEAFRSRHRMADATRFRAWFPRWLLGLLITDLQRGQFDRFSRDRAGVEALIRDAGVEPTWYIDGETSGGQVFGAQGAGALLAFPSTMKWYIAPEGTWVRLNGGELDLGIVRDSVLNATNDFQSFGEVFETIAKIGIESLAITTTICANGVVSAPAAPSGC